MKSRFYIKILISVIIIQIFSLSCTHSQMLSERRIPERGTNFSSPALFGEVIRVDNSIIKILSQTGEKEELFITTETIFVRENIITRNQIRKGDNLLLIGHTTEGDTIYPRRIVVQDTRGDERMKTRPMSPPAHRSEGFAPDIHAPLIGEVTNLEPLTIKLTSGLTKNIKITEMTKLVQTTVINPSKIAKGVQISVMTQPKQGGYNKEAIRVIVLTEGELLFQKKPAAAFGDIPKRGERREIHQADRDIISSSQLLPDIRQQSLNPDFIYGIWLGRGLFSNKELDRAFKVAGNLGIKYFKVEFKWSYVEPENNRWQWNNESTLDVEYLIKLAKDYDFSIIPYFTAMMPWGERRYLDPRKNKCEGPSNMRGQFQPPDPHEYGEYIFTVVDKLKKNGVDVRYIELDNEISNLNDGYRSWNCFINMTAKQIKEAENIAYDKVKASYPKIMVSSTTFSFPGLPPKDFEISEKLKKRRNSFIKVYFEDKPKPKFDFLAIHEVLIGSGNPYTILRKSKDAGYVYNFGSYYDAYDMWREILDKYGYQDKPIFNLESGAVEKGKQDVILLQRAIFAKTQDNKNKVIGWVLSQLTGSKIFTEERGSEGFSVGITELGNGYKLKEGYLGYYTLMTTLSRYPNYEGKVIGELNTKRPWVEKFSDNTGNILYAAFIPYSDLTTIKSQAVTLYIGPNKEAKITKSAKTNSMLKSDISGYITITVDTSPAFIEVIH